MKAMEIAQRIIDFSGRCFEAEDNVRVAKTLQQAVAMLRRVMNSADLFDCPCEDCMAARALIAELEG